MLRKMNAFPMFEKHLWKVEKSYKKKSQKKEKKKNPQIKNSIPSLFVHPSYFPGNWSLEKPRNKEPEVSGGERKDIYEFFQARCVMKLPRFSAGM